MSISKCLGRQILFPLKNVKLTKVLYSNYLDVKTIKYLSLFDEKNFDFYFILFYEMNHLCKKRTRTIYI